MLQAIRENSQGWIAWVIVGLIIITFALFGIDQYAQSEKTIIVAEVNGDEITGNEFLRLYGQQKQRLQSQFGDMYDQVINDETLREKILDALIESKLIQQYASAGNMSVSDEQLSAIIQGSDVFHKDGVFDEETYNQILLRNGLSPARYEYEQRKFLLENQFKNITSASVFTTDTQLKSLAKLQFQERKFNYLRIDQRLLADSITVSESQIADYFEENKRDYVVPERITVDYLLLDQKDIAKKITVNEDVLDVYYQDNQDQFTSPEQREASHILVRVDQPNQEESALKKIVKIQEKIKAGEDFGKLAKEFSDDPGSAALNGDLGKFQQGMMVAEFDDSVFSLEEGQISEPVKTDFGYHIIKLTKVYPKFVKDYVDVKKEVETGYRAKEAEQQYFNLLEQLNTLTYEQPDTLESASIAIDVAVATSKPFSKQGGDGAVISNQKVIAAAFAEEVKNNGVNSSSIELTPTSSVVVRVNKVFPATQKEFADVSQEIEKTIKQQQGKKASAELAATILEKVNSGTEFKSFEKDGVEYKTVTAVQRDNSTLLPLLTNAVFKAPKPSLDKPSYVTSVLSLGDSIVIELLKVTDGVLPTNAVELEKLKNTGSLIQTESEISSRIDSLLEKADINKRESYKTLK